MTELSGQLSADLVPRRALASTVVSRTDRSPRSKNTAVCGRFEGAIGVDRHVRDNAVRAYIGRLLPLFLGTSQALQYVVPMFVLIFFVTQLRALSGVA